MKTTPIVMVVFAIVVAIPFVASNYNKKKLAQWDAQVAEWCENEGGIFVYETVEVSPRMNPNLIFTRYGISLPSERYADSEDPYFRRLESEELRRSDPAILKSTSSIIRSSDLFILGEKIGYIRLGGDFPPVFLGTGTSFSCSHLSDFEINLTNAVFNIVGD